MPKSPVILFLAIVTLTSISRCAKIVTETKNMKMDAITTSTAATPAIIGSSKTMMDDSKTMMENSKTTVDNSKSMKDSSSSKIEDTSSEIMDVDLMAVMTECNDSFRIEMSYLQSLNESGSFPDETDKTPKCYLRCVLQMLEVASPSGVLDPERAAVIFAGERNGEPVENIRDMTTSCADRQETDLCEMAYGFMKCLFYMEIEKYNSRSKS